MLLNQLSKVKWLRIGLFLLACVFGVYGVITNHVEYALLASLSIFFSFINLKKNKSIISENVIPNKYQVNSDQLVLTITLLFYALILIVIAVFLSPKPSTGIISLILWLISIGFLISAGVVFDGVKPLAWGEKFRSYDTKKRRNIIIEISIVFLITAFAFAIRAINLDIYPTAMHGDEGEIGMEALRFLGVGEPMSPFSVGWGPVPRVYYVV
ncbi:MAG: hypothetical protein C0410_07995, partial [Anaerolinea sp.]|nr:hypothetical protein [Anaerolinea sp.]